MLADQVLGYMHVKECSIQPMETLTESHRYDCSETT